MLPGYPLGGRNQWTGVGCVSLRKNSIYIYIFHGKNIGDIFAEKNLSFMGKNHGEKQCFPVDLPLNQTIESKSKGTWMTLMCSRPWGLGLAHGPCRWVAEPFLCRIGGWSL